jgi:hypothetical protein
LWPRLDAALRALDDAHEANVARQLVRIACRPTVQLAEGETLVLEHGLPTGSPIQQPLANLYLVALDEALDARPVFYARFGDDLFVATANVAEAERAAADLASIVAQLELGFNAAKTRNLYFTKPGRPVPFATALAFRPTSHVEYLGTRVDFDGRSGLTRKRLRQLLQRSRWRVENSARLGESEGATEGAKQAVARALNEALTTTSSVADPSSEALRTWIDDRAQLRQLDRQLAQHCAEVLSGKRGVRAFRHTSIADLRAAGLSSLLELRRRDRRRT